MNQNSHIQTITQALTGQNRDLILSIVVFYAFHMYLNRTLFKHFTKRKFLLKISERQFATTTSSAFTMAFLASKMEPSQTERERVKSHTVVEHLRVQRV